MPELPVQTVQKEVMSIGEAKSFLFSQHPMILAVVLHSARFHSKGEKR